jgi:uncharacterized membrane protein YeiB
MMICYVLVIVRFAQSATGRRWLAPLEDAGRMPLTNDLMQTAICITLFYGWGFGLWLKVGPALGLALAFGIWRAPGAAAALSPGCGAQGTTAVASISTSARSSISAATCTADIATL